MTLSFKDYSIQGNLKGLLKKPKSFSASVFILHRYYPTHPPAGGPTLPDFLAGPRAALNKLFFS